MGLWMQIQPDPIRARLQGESVMVADKVAQSAEATLLYSTYLGGDGADYGKDVAVDADGNIYVLGQTYSDTLFDEEIERSGYSDIFVAKFDPTGSANVRQIRLDEANWGQHQLVGFDDAPVKAILVISALAPVTTSVAQYTYSLQE